MSRVKVELYAGPDDGHDPVLELARGVLLPERLAARDGRERYTRTDRRTKGRLAYSLAPGRVMYAWEPEQPARRRPECLHCVPIRRGCPGYKPTEPRKK